MSYNTPEVNLQTPSEYHPVEKIDVPQYSSGEPTAASEQLTPVQRQSLQRFVYEIKEGDAIFVTEGPKIVCKGVVTGPYQFDKVGRIKSATAHWRHQRSVKCYSDYPEVVFQLSNQQ